MKTFYITCAKVNYMFRNKVQCDAVKVEGNSIVCYINERIVGVFPCEDTIVISPELNSQQIQ